MGRDLGYMPNTRNALRPILQCINLLLPGWYGRADAVAFQGTY
jgi:hypothetical protein